MIDALLVVDGHPLAALLDIVWPFERTVRTATGWTGLGIIFVYSFLIAFVLPAPSEVVLFASLGIGPSHATSLSLIVLTSSVGKAAGSLVALRVGQGVRHSGPVVERLRRSRFDVVEWSERRTVELVRRWGYVGLALALCVPFFPDTASVYAFSVVEEDEAKFALATFAGSVGRLLLVIFLVGGSLVVL